MDESEFFHGDNYNPYFVFRPMIRKTIADGNIQLIKKLVTAPSDEMLNHYLKWCVWFEQLKILEYLLTLGLDEYKVISRAKALVHAIISDQLKVAQWLFMVKKIHTLMFQSSAYECNKTYRWIVTRKETKLISWHYCALKKSDIGEYRMLFNPFSDEHGCINLKSAGVGDKCCKWLSKAYFQTTSINALTINLENNPKNCEKGLSYMINALRNPLVVVGNVNYQLCFSNLSPEELNAFRGIALKHKGLTVHCEFPTLLTIANAFICKILNRAWNVL